MEGLLQDLRFALRRLAATPGFTLAAVLSLAVGIGASTALFTAVNGVLLRPLPLPGAERVVALPREGDVESDVSVPDIADLRERVRSLSAAAAVSTGWDFDLVGEDEPRRLVGAVADPEFFDVLGLAPLLGRPFTSADNVAGGPHVALLSENAWRRLFNGDSGVVGRAITLSDNPTTIIGVMPAAADIFGANWDLYAPIAVVMPWAVAGRGTNHLEAVGRLAAGVTLERAAAEVRSVTTALATEYPQTNGGKILAPVPLQEFLTGATRGPLLMLLGAVTLVLLIICVNLTNFLLARATVRGPELAVRQALGAGQLRLVRQLLAESVVVAGLGGIAGTVLAFWGTDLLAGLAPAGLPRAENVGADLRVLGFTLVLTVLTGLAVGLAPALSAGRTDPAAALGSGAARTGGGRWRQRRLEALVAAQVAISLVLLVGAGLMLRSLQALMRVDLGFDPVAVTTAGIVLPESRYSVAEPQTRALTGMVDAVAALPGVTHAAFVIGAPLHASAIGNTVVPEQPAAALEGGVLGARVRPVLGDYFGVMRIPLLSGRLLTAADRRGSPPVAVVNQSFADAVWPGQDPIGRRFRFRGGAVDSTITIVGVVGDVRASGRAAGDSRAVYFPFEQRDANWLRFGTLVLRTRDAGTQLGRGLYEAVWTADRTVPLTDVGPLAGRVSGSAGRERFLAQLLTCFALAALLVAIQGIYATLAYAVSVRRREIGIRLALGAGRTTVVGMVLRRGLRAAGAGIVAGSLAAWFATRAVQSFLFGVTAVDPVAWLLAATGLAAVALLASWLPARLAARVEPMDAIKGE